MTSVEGSRILQKYQDESADELFKKFINNENNLDADDQAITGLSSEAKYLIKNNDEYMELYQTLSSELVQKCKGLKDYYTFYGGVVDLESALNDFKHRFNELKSEADIYAQKEAEVFYKEIFCKALGSADEIKPSELSQGVEFLSDFGLRVKNLVNTYCEEVQGDDKFKNLQKRFPLDMYDLVYNIVVRMLNMKDQEIQKLVMRLKSVESKLESEKGNNQADLEEKERMNQVLQEQYFKEKDREAKKQETKLRHLKQDFDILQAKSSNIEKENKELQKENENLKENERKLSFNLIEKQQKLVSLETALEKSNLVRSNWDKFEDHINRTSMSLFAQNQQKQSQISHQGSLVGFSPNNKESLPYNMSDSDWQNINIVNWHVIQVVKDELSNIRLRTANYCQSKKNDKNTPSYENALKKKIEDCLARENDLQNKIISLQEMQYMNESELKDRISQLQDQNRQKINQVSGDIHRFQIAVNGKDSKITELENRIKVKESDASSVILFQIIFFRKKNF